MEKKSAPPASEKDGKGKCVEARASRIEDGGDAKDTTTKKQLIYVRPAAARAATTVATLSESTQSASTQTSLRTMGNISPAEVSSLSFSSPTPPTTDPASLLSNRATYTAWTWTLETFDACRKKAQQDPEAAARLAFFYTFGMNAVALDNDRAFAYAKSAYEAGVHSVGWLYARAHLYGYGTKVDKEKALELIGHSVNTNCIAAVYHACYLDDKKKEKSATKSIPFPQAVLDLVCLANADDPIAAYWAGQCYQRIKNLPASERDKVKLLKCDEYYRKASEQGHAYAQFALGWMYRDGCGGVEMDCKEAAKWFQRASEANYATAQNDLAVLFYTGQGVDKDLNRAFELWTSASKANNAEAMFSLAECYRLGHGVAADPAEAANICRRAIERVYDSSECRTTDASDKGRLGGILPLAHAFASGVKGVERNWPEALRLFRKAQALIIRGHLFQTVIWSLLPRLFQCDIEERTPHRVMGKGNYGVSYLGKLKVAGSEPKHVLFKRYKPKEPTKAGATTDLKTDEGDTVDLKTDPKDGAIELAALLAIGDHPNIAKFHGVFQHDRYAQFSGDLEYAFDYAANGTLETALEKRKFTPLQVLRMARDLTAAVAHIHSRNIIHRDIAERNLVLTKDDCLQLIDFGLARFLDERGLYPDFALGSYAPPRRSYLPSAPTAMSGDIKMQGLPDDICRLGEVLKHMILGACNPSVHMEPEEVEIQYRGTADHRVLRAMRLALHEDPSQRPSAAVLYDILTTDRSS